MNFLLLKTKVTGYWIIMFQSTIVANFSYRNRKCEKYLYIYVFTIQQNWFKIENVKSCGISCSALHTIRMFYVSGVVVVVQTSTTLKNYKYIFAIWFSFSAPVSRIVKYFRSDGTPLITVGGYTYDFAHNKTTCDNEFYMLIRIGLLSFQTISNFMVNTMKL